ncbi:MAG: hypothetical protein TREMPRED_000481 [Tremellales sp. Tagirdzhanova-0007]|nr:MAG: hypothetical protein TREMPRED_000481 [Tremellales sp. Tagirdzhanova-0007]
MMYTPTPSARRPRPPGSRSRPRSSADKLEHHTSVRAIISPSSEDHSDAPLPTHIGRRQEYNRTGLARISASPSEVGDVSVGLDFEDPSKPSDVCLPSNPVEPSPPPPYGTSLPDVPTPPRQLPGKISRRPSEIEMEQSEDMSEDDLKLSLKSMRMSLRRRKDGKLVSGTMTAQLRSAELFMAAATLHRLSPVHASSSSTAYSGHMHNPNNISPDLSSSSHSLRASPERPFRTVRAKDVSLPFPLHHVSSRPRPSSSSQSSSHYTRLQAEADERIVSLEQALSEARESEDAQRKLAARLRRDFDKLQRDFERAEERGSRDSTPVVPIASASTSMPRERDGRRRRETTIGKDLRANHTRADFGEQSKAGWGSTAFPEFPPGPPRARGQDAMEMGEVTERLGRMKMDAASHDRPVLSSFATSESTELVDDMISPGSTSSAGSTTLHVTDTLSRRSVHRLALPLISQKLRKGSLSDSTDRPQRSPTPLSPRHRVQAISPPAQESRRTRASFRRSPWPSPVLPRVALASPTSLGAKVASMRTFVSSNLGLTASSKPGRNLSTELGSEFGDDWGRTLRSLDDTHNMSSDDESEHISDPPAPLPPRVSAALSSLAMALAPHRISSGSIPPKSSSFREPDRDVGEYRSLSKAVKVRRIDWADSNKKGDVCVSKVTGWGKSVRPWEVGDVPDELSESSDGRRPSRLYARPVVLRTVSGGTDGSVALAHRRRPSTLPISLGQRAEHTDMMAEWEAQTIPAKVVNDIICLLTIFVECVECAIIVLYCVMLEIRHGRLAHV